MASADAGRSWAVEARSGACGGRVAVENVCGLAYIDSPFPRPPEAAGHAQHSFPFDIDAHGHGSRFAARGLRLDPPILPQAGIKKPRKQTHSFWKALAYLIRPRLSLVALLRLGLRRGGIAPSHKPEAPGGRGGSVKVSDRLCSARHGRWSIAQCDDALFALETKLCFPQLDSPALRTVRSTNIDRLSTPRNRPHPAMADLV